MACSVNILEVVFGLERMIYTDKTTMMVILQPVYTMIVAWTGMLSNTALLLNTIAEWIKKYRT